MDSAKASAGVAGKLLDNLLRCPCPLHHEVVIDRMAETVVCNAAQCPLRRQQPFPILDGQPVLVDFGSSVLDKAATIQSRGAPLIRRRGGWQRKMSRFVFGDKPKSSKNAGRFLEQLKKKDHDLVVLVIGGATVGRGSELLYRDDRVKIISLDVYRSEHTDLVADAHSLPLLEGAIDGVWIQAVLEHVLSPKQVVAEIYRVLRPGGIVYAETPFMQQVHEGPYDFTRFTESGHRWLFRRFERIDSGAERGPFTVLLWSIRYAFAGLLRSHRAATLICTLLFWLRYFDQLVPEAYAIDGASDFYFLGRKSGLALRPKDITASYAGAQR